MSKGAIAFRQAQQQLQLQQSHHHQSHYTHGSHHNAHRNNSSGHHRRSGGGGSRHSSLTKRSTREQQTDRYLHPGMLKYHRHAVSVDESHHPPCLRPILSNNGRHNVLGSQPTMSSSTSPTHDSVLRMIKRSDTAKQHVLARQRNIENEDNSQHQHQTSHHHSRGRRSVILGISFKCHPPF